MRVHRSLIALFAAAAALGLTVLTWWLSFRTGVGNRADIAVLSDVTRLRETPLYLPLGIVALSGNVLPYAVLALLVMRAAVKAGGLLAGGAVAAVIFVPNAVTQALKVVTAEDRVGAAETARVGVAAESWPSGHATASLILVLCAVAVAPPARRGLVAGLGAAYSATVGLAVVTLGWHFPSDVVGGYLVAMTAAALALAAGLPQRLVGAVRPAREDEEQVRQPVEVAHGLR